MVKKATQDKPASKILLNEAIAKLNDTLNESEKKAKRIIEEHAERVQEFQNEFKICVHKINRPTMAEAAKKFAVIGMAREVTKEDEQKFGLSINLFSNDHVSYYFQVRNSRYSFIVNIAGNPNSQKTTIGLYTANEKPIVKEFNVKVITPQVIENELAGKLVDLTKKLNK